MKYGRLVFWFVIIMAVLVSGNVLAEGSVLKLPADLKVIDVEAFYGSTSIDKVVLPDTVTAIYARAFANSTITEINLPSSLTFIDYRAFDGCQLKKVTAEQGTYAYEWAVKKVL